MLLLIIPFVFSDTTYSNLGGSQTDYQRGNGKWNSALDLNSLPLPAVRSLGTQEFYPLVEDLDNDGNLEIVIKDGDTIRVYQNKTLDIVTTYDYGTSGDTSNLIAFDIDGDGRKEVIFYVYVGKNIHILDFDGTNFSNNGNVDTLGGALTISNTPEVVIGCKGVNDCAIVHTNSITSNTGVKEMRITGFNSTGEASTTSLIVDTVNGGGTLHNNFCLPKFRHLNTVDDAFSFSYAHVSQTGGNQAGNIKQVTRSGTTLTTAVTIEESSSVFAVSGSFNCVTQNIEKYLTSPLVTNIDTGLTGNEFVFAVATSTTEFKMYSYKNDGTFIDDYPELTQANGNIMSNVMLFDSFEGTTDSNFCVAGYSVSANELNLVCGSTQNTPNTREYEYSGINSLFVVNDSYQNYNPLSHAVQYSQVKYIGFNFNELITPYGVFSLDANAGIFDPTKLNLEYLNTKGDGVIVPSDFSNVGLEDLIFMNNKNIYLIEDNFENTKGKITKVQLNPCIEKATAKQNTSLNVQVTVEDVEGDNVFTEITVYDNLPNNQTFIGENSTSGKVFSPTFILNETIANGILTIKGFDVKNPLNPDVQTYLFTVASQGVNFNDCTDTFTFDLVDIEAGITVQDVIGTQNNNNTITATLGQIQQLTGIGGAVIWILGLFLLSFFLFMSAKELEATATTMFSIVALINILGIILGTMLGILSSGIIISLVVLGLIVLGFWFKRMASSDTV